MKDQKIIFFDLDGTLIDHSINAVPESTLETIKSLKNHGHIVVIATGRPPCLFYDVDKELDIRTFIASNGRYAKHNNDVIWSDFIDSEVVDRFVKDMEKRNIDIAFESVDDFVINKKTNHLADKFIDYFNLKTPRVEQNYHSQNRILQMVLFYDRSDFSEIAKNYPELDFNISCPYGIDINKTGGMKEVGMIKVLQHLGLKKEDSIAVGDGYNDITMVELAGIGIAMGNACEPLKEAADIVTDACNEDGIYKVFKKLNMI